MDAIIDAIRAALVKDAAPEARAAGIAACRSVLAALEPKPDVPSPPIGAASVASLIAAVRGASPDQLLDLAIAKLRSAVPAGAEVTPAKPLNFQFVPVRRRG